MDVYTVFGSLIDLHLKTEHNPLVLKKLEDRKRNWILGLMG